jgi:hypothetical protein
VNRAPRPSASRLAAVGAALSLVAVPAPVALAADAVGAPGKPATKVAPPAAPDDAAVDDDLIEFLGSIGDTAEEGDWLDFLSNTDIDKVAKRGAKPPPRER